MGGGGHDDDDDAGRRAKACFAHPICYSNPLIKLLVKDVQTNAA